MFVDSCASEARARAKKLRQAGKGVEADELDNLCDVADSASRISKAGINARTWDNIKLDYNKVEQGGYGEGCPSARRSRSQAR